MNHVHHSQSTLRIGACLFLFGILLAAPAIAADGPGQQPAAGVTVTIDEETDRNRVSIEIGDDILEIASSRFHLTTSSTDSRAIDRSIVLWPESRSREDTATGRAFFVFNTGFTLAADDRRVVFYDLGRCATEGDAAVWIPGERILIAGRLATAGRVEATLDTDLAAWIKSLERLRGLGPKVVIPGRGAIGSGELLTTQIERLEALRQEVESGLLDGLAAEEIATKSKLSWFADWRREDPQSAGAAVDAMVYEVGGLRMPWELKEKRLLREGESPTRQDPEWTPPRKILWRNYWPERLPLLSIVAPGVEIVPFESSAEAVQHVDDADAVIGTATREILAAGSRLRWVQVGSAGVERYLAIPQLGSGEVLLTNGQKLASPEIAEHVMALTRALARGLNYAVTAQNRAEWIRSDIGDKAPLQRLRGKTMLVVGLGGIGTEVARLAAAAEMRVTGIRSSRRSGPSFVDQVGLTEDLAAFAAEADVVVNCLPMTPDTADIFDSALFETMKPTAFFVNVGRGGTVDTEALVDALHEGKISAAGLDVTDPEPLPPEHPLWKAPNLIITPHYSAWSDIGRERRWLLYRENLRRFVAGEPMLSVVDPERGY